MNQNLKRSLWVMALGMAFAGFGKPSRAAAIPAKQGQEQDRYKNQERKDNQNGDSEHPRPSDANDLRAYEDGYKQGSRNTTMSGPKAPGKVRKIWWTRRH